MSKQSLVKSKLKQVNAILNGLRRAKHSLCETRNRSKGDIGYFQYKIQQLDQQIIKAE